MKRLFLICIVLGGLLQSCQKNLKVVSEAQKTACRERAEQAPLVAKMRELYAQCLEDAQRSNQHDQKSIASAASPAPTIQPPPVATPSAPKQSKSNENRYIYCQLNRDQVNAAYARLIYVTKPWIVVNRSGDPDGPEYKEAKKNMEEARAELDRLIPPEMRKGQDLIPDAINTFRTCDRKAFQ